MRARKGLIAAALAAASGSAALADARPTAEELELVARSLRPEGRAELERNAGALERHPLYEVEAELDPKAARVTGTLRLLYLNRESAPLEDLVLRLWPRASTGTSLDVSAVRIDGIGAKARTRGTVAEIRLQRPLLPGARLELRLDFRARLRKLQQGDDDLLAGALPALGQLSAVQGPKVAGHGYGTLAAGPHGAVLVDWYPQLAVRAQGRWDRREPAGFGDLGRAEPASAVVALTVPKGFRVEGAGVALGQRATSSGREVAAFAIAGARGPLGLVASQQYETSSEKVGAVELRAASLHGESGARDLLSCAKQALRELERRFGPYPWASLSLAHASLTGGAGGVEQPGLALVARALGGDGWGRALEPSLFQFTCWHEVAHQWWQAVVGSDPQRAAWVDEALAQFSASLVAEAAAPGAPSRQAGREALARHVAANFQMMRLLGGADGSVARDTAAFPSEIAYAGLVYGKAPLFFERVRDLLGDAGFDAAVRAYRGAWAFREAGPSAFLETAVSVAPAHAAELRALDRRWLREAHGDEDIGPIDAFALFGGSGLGFMKTWMNGSPGRMPTDEEMKQLMESMGKLGPQIQELLEQLGGKLPVDEE